VGEGRKFGVKTEGGSPIINVRRVLKTAEEWRSGKNLDNKKKTGRVWDGRIILPKESATRGKSVIMRNNQEIGRKERLKKLRITPFSRRLGVQE